MADFKTLIILIFCLQSITSFSQDNSWQWINPYPLPFFTSMVEGVNDEIYVWNKYNELYRWEDDGSVRYIDTPLPIDNFNYETDKVSAYTYIINDSTWYFYNPAWGNHYTKDGGESYTQTEFTANGFHLNLQAINENHIIAIAQGEAASHRKLLTTEDNGQSWKEIYYAKGSIKPFQISTDTIFAIAADTIIHTFDGGENWTKGAECKSCFSLQFQNQTLYISNNNEKIFISEDYGISYDLLYLVEHDENQLGITGGSPRFKIDDEIGIAISPQRIFVTENAGESFEFYDHNFGHLNTKFINGRRFIISANGGPKTILEFDLESKSIINHFTNELTNLDNFHVIQDSIYLLTSHSNNWDFRKMHISYDKGYNWETMILPINDSILGDWLGFYGFDIIQEDLCVLAINRRIFKSNFPYDDWTESPSPLDTSIRVMQFWNNNEALLIDYFHNVFYTEDQAETWTKVTQLNQFYHFVDIFTSSELQKTFVLEQPGNGISQTILYEFENGALQDSIIFFDKREDYHGGFILDDSILYLSFYHRTYEVNMSTGEYEQLCFMNRGKIIHAQNDTLWVISKGIISTMDKECQIFSSDTMSYSWLTQFGNPNKLELYMDDSGKAFGYYPDGYMLTYTDDFREDLLVYSHEMSFPENKSAKTTFLYPNPTTGEVILNSTLKNPTIFFYSTDGKRIGTYKGNSFTLDQNMKGLYFYNVLEDGKYVTTGKIVVE